jgi:hypothetical protein
MRPDPRTLTQIEGLGANRCAICHLSRCHVRGEKQLSTTTRTVLLSTNTAAVRKRGKGGRATFATVASIEALAADLMWAGGSVRKDGTR